MPFKWSYGLTTVPERKDDPLPRTLASLEKAGFPCPRLFVDDCKDPAEYAGFGLEVTTRYSRIRTMGNWWLALVELYCRQPNADRYAIFQDDFVTYEGLRDYLESCKYPTKGYLNLYTVPSNEALCSRQGLTPPCWYPSDQLGKGAVALVFDLDTVTTLLGAQHWIQRPKDQHRGWRAIDGGIVTALRYAGWKEYVHFPTLTQHTGKESTTECPKMGAPYFPETGLVAPKALFPMPESFRGESFDARTMIQPPDEERMKADLDAWETEKRALEEAIAGDEERLSLAPNPMERSKFERHIFRYKADLVKHLALRQQ